MWISPPALLVLGWRSPPLLRWCRIISPPKTGANGLPLGRMVALVGDAELDEGNVYEALQEGWKNDLRNTWWIIDYNRQSLDGVVREGLFKRIEQIFDAFGWDVVKVKYGALQRAAFTRNRAATNCATGSTIAPTSFTRRSPLWAARSGANG